MTHPLSPGLYLGPPHPPLLRGWCHRPHGCPHILPLPTHRPPEPVPFCKAFYFHVRNPPLCEVPWDHWPVPPP